MTRIVALGDRDPQYLTHREIDAALALFPDDVDAGWVATDSPGARARRRRGGLAPPGTPYRDEDAAFAAIEHCLATGTPFLGTCGGFQYACVHLARRFGRRCARTPRPIRTRTTRRSCRSPARCTGRRARSRRSRARGSRRSAATAPFEGFHWCGYGLADRTAGLLPANGVVVSATAPMPEWRRSSCPTTRSSSRRRSSRRSARVRAGRLHPVARGASGHGARSGA